MGFAGSTPINQRLPVDVLVETGNFSDLQNAILAIPPNLTRNWVVAARGNYSKITKPITVPSNVTLDLRGAYLQADSGGVLASSSTPAIVILGPANYTTTTRSSGQQVFGGTIDGNLQNVDGIVLNGGVGGNYISDCIVYGVLVKNCGHNAGILVNGQDNLIMGCTVDSETPQIPGNATNGGFWATGTSVARIRFTDCIARNGVANANGKACGFIVDDGTVRITFDGCISYNNPGAGFAMVASPGTHGKEWGVFNCRSMDNLNGSGIPKGFLVQYCDGLQIQNCFASHNSGTGILADNCNDALISTNICKNNGVDQNPEGGIRITNSARVSLVGNRCYDDQGSPTQAYGIILDTGSTAAFLESNVLLNNLTGALKINAGTDHWIMNNRGYNPGPLGLLGLDNRTGVTAVDGAPITLYAVPAASSLLFRITADIFATAFTSGTATYTITWTENAVARTLVVTATALNTLGTGTDLINPDASTNITAQLTGVFTATVKISAVVEQLA